jgi:hypothetical protein
MTRRFGRETASGGDAADPDDVVTSWILAFARMTRVVWLILRPLARLWPLEFLVWAGDDRVS